VRNGQAGFFGHIFELRDRQWRRLRGSRLGKCAQREQQAQREDCSHDEENVVIIDDNLEGQESAW